MHYGALGAFVPAAAGATGVLVAGTFVAGATGMLASTGVLAGALEVGTLTDVEGRFKTW